jgi:serine/threonine protein kinase
LMVGDVFVLLSDGVHGVCSAAQFKAQLLAMVASQKTAQEMSDALVHDALKAGSQDNASALVIQVRGLLDATLYDQNRIAQHLSILPKLKVGAQIDGLVVTAVVAESGINIIYQVRDIETRKLFAMKTLDPARAHDQDERAMLAHEAWLAKHMQTSQAASSLVAIHERAPGLHGEQAQPSGFYLLYDWHAGETLQHVLDRGQRVSVSQAQSVALQTLRALGALHRQNIIHRDVKPANLHQGEDGVLRLIDLGVALTGNEPESMRKLHAGTPSFINPEQWGYDGTKGEIAPESADAQSDLFALGVTLYQLLTGKLPYGEVLPYQSGRYRRDPLAPSRLNPEIPIWLDHVLLKAVALHKPKRFETAEEFLLAVERGATRPLLAPVATPLIERDPSARWKLALGLSVLFNVLLVYWLVFLPT